MHTAIQINNWLQTHHLTPLFPYEPGKVVSYEGKIFAMIHNYVTIVERDGREYFLKIPLTPEKVDELKLNVQFLQFLNQQKSLTFKIPQLIEYNLDSDIPYYITEKMDGELLGNSVEVNAKFATPAIMIQLNKGFKEIWTLSDNKNEWHETKNIDWIKRRLSEFAQNNDIINIVGKSTLDNLAVMLNSNALPAGRQGQIPNSKLWGDPGPNNFLVQNETLVMIDFGLFIKGYQHADFAEFASFCVFSNVWQQFFEMTEQNRDPIFQLFFKIFLIDRLISVLWLEKRGQLHQLKNQKEYYFDLINKYLEFQ